MDQVPSNSPTLIVASDAAAAPKVLHGAMAPWLAEFAVLLLRGSAVVLLLSPALLVAALLF